MTKRFGIFLLTVFFVSMSCDASLAGSTKSKTLQKRNVAARSQAQRSGAQLSVNANAAPPTAQAVPGANPLEDTGMFGMGSDMDSMFMLMMAMGMLNQNKPSSSSERFFGGLPQSLPGASSISPIAPDSSYSIGQISAQGGAQNWPEEWQKHFLKVLQDPNCGPNLMKIPSQELENTCPNVGVNSKPAMKNIAWLTLFQNLGWEESNNRAAPCKTAGDCSSMGAKGVMQLSVSSIHQDAYMNKNCQYCNRGNIQSDNDLLDPKKNIACAVVIADHLIQQSNGVIAKGNQHTDGTGGGMARYWQPLMTQDAHKKDRIFARTKGVCQKIAQGMQSDPGAALELAGFSAGTSRAARGDFGGGIPDRGLASAGVNAQ